MTPGYPPPTGQPLSVGNVVSAGLRLYSSHFGQYFGVAFLATLWMLLPFAVVIGIVIFFATVQNYYGLLGLIIPAWFVLLLYCIAKYSAGTAAISRLAFGELANQPETAQQAGRFTQSRKWGYLIAGLLVSLIYGGIAIVFYLALVILFVVLFSVGSGAAALSGSPETFITDVLSDPGAGIAVFLGTLLLVGLFFALLAWLGARLAIVYVPLSIEAETGGMASVGRSWSLTQRNAWRVFLVLLVTFLITLPLLFIVQIIAGILQVSLTTAATSTVASGTTDPTVTSFSILIAQLISFVIGIAASVLTVPLWQSISAAIYYDLRSRREGLGLQLRN